MCKLVGSLAKELSDKHCGFHQQTIFPPKKYFIFLILKAQERKGPLCLPLLYTKNCTDLQGLFDYQGNLFG